jgi:hypothetical protein
MSFRSCLVLPSSFSCSREYLVNFLTLAACAMARGLSISQGYGSLMAGAPFKAETFFEEPSPTCTQHQSPPGPVARYSATSPTTGTCLMAQRCTPPPPPFPPPLPQPLPALQVTTHLVLFQGTPPHHPQQACASWRSAAPLHPPPLPTPRPTAPPTLTSYNPPGPVSRYSATSPTAGTCLMPQRCSTCQALRCRS